MVQFNPDGSIKLPQRALEQKQDEARRMTATRCLKIRKEVVSVHPPKQCLLHIDLSEAIKDPTFVQNTLRYAAQSSETPIKIKPEGQKITVEIGTSFRRCSDCTRCIGRLKELMDGNVIVNKGNCTYTDPSERAFSYNDYFD